MGGEGADQPVQGRVGKRAERVPSLGCLQADPDRAGIQGELSEKESWPQKALLLPRCLDGSRSRHNWDAAVWMCSTPPALVARTHSAG